LASSVVRVGGGGERLTDNQLTGTIRPGLANLTGLWWLSLAANGRFKVGDPGLAAWLTGLDANWAGGC
jgi:hypothetical protein